MEALVCVRLGDPTLPHSEEDAPLVIVKKHPIPALNSPTSVRVRVAATSLNYANYLSVQGQYQERATPPFIPGSDFSGIVDSIGSTVSKFRVGDRVCSLENVGTFAEFIVVDESRLFKIPEGCDLKAAAAIPVAFGTSHLALIRRANLTSGQVLLVLGAAGGVGLTAVQIGKLTGAVVIAVARGEEKAELLKSFGADHVIDSGVGNLMESVRGFLKKRNLEGVDVLYDPVGGKLAKDSLRLLNWSAHILVIGFASGHVPIIPANVVLVKNWTVHGIYMGKLMTYEPEIMRKSMEQLLAWIARGKLTVHVSQTFTLSEATVAFSAIKDRKVIGKVLLLPGNPMVTSSKL